MFHLILLQFYRVLRPLGASCEVPGGPRKSFGRARVESRIVAEAGSGVAGIGLDDAEQDRAL